MVEQFPYRRLSGSDARAVRIRLGTNKPRVSVVVAVHNGGQVVRDCLRSVVAESPTAHRVIVIDDASDDVETRRILDEFQERGMVELIRHENNRGYTRTANHGLALTEDDDVVLLNSDTVVAPMWLQRLTWTAYGQPGIGTVSAVSNDAAANSVPFRHQRNDWYPRFEWSGTARLMSRGMRVWSQEVPSAHGFCMYIRRKLIRKLGPLDKEGFPLGYGEEVDYSQKAILAGWSNVVAPHVLIKHLRSQSFGIGRRKKLVEESKVVLRDRYPNLVPDVANWESSVGAALIQHNAARVRSGWAVGEPSPRTVMVEGVDLRSWRVSLTEDGAGHLQQGDWCFPAGQQYVHSLEALVDKVTEMILFGCAESVVDQTLSSDQGTVLRHLAADLGVRYASTAKIGAIELN